MDQEYRAGSRASAYTRRFLLASMLGITGVFCVLGLGAKFREEVQVASKIDIEAAYGRVMYDFQKIEDRFDPNAKSPVPQWMIGFLGVDFFHTITWVDLDSRSVTDATMESVANLTNLEQLHLSNTQTSCKGLRHIAKLQQLRRITINNSGLTDDCGEIFKELSRLEVLGIENETVTGALLKSVAENQNLKTLRLYNTQIVDSDVEQLQRQRSDLLIDFF